MKPVTRQKINIIIDIIMFVVMAALAVIGFIIRYKIIPGSERWIKYGRNVELTIWGMDRHEWGFIHLVLGISIAVLLILHIIFHWDMIICLIKRLFPLRAIRFASVSALLLVSSLIILAPFYFTPEVGAPIRGQGEGYGRMQSFNNNPSQQGIFDNPDNIPSKQEITGNPDNKSSLQVITDPGPSLKPEKELTAAAGNSEENKLKEEPESPVSHEEERILDIRGYNTIADLAGRYHISADDLKSELGIPAGVPNMERLGRIRRIYGFTMREVEDCILSLQE